MRALIGQAAWRTGRMLHTIAGIALVLLMLLAGGAGALVWRLSQGPLDLPWLVGPLERALNSEGPWQVTVGTASLAWEGFHGGSDRPLDIRLTEVTAVDAQGAPLAEIPQAAVTVSTRALLVGRIVPYSIELDGLKLNLVRAEDGSIALDLGGAAPAAGSPVLSDLLNGLDRLRLRDASFTLTDHRLGMIWQAPQASFALRRAGPAGFAGDADVALVLGDTHLRVSAAALPRPGAPGTEIRYRLSPFTPSDLAPLAPAFAPLAAVDAPVTLTGAADFDAGHALAGLRVQARLGQGRIRLGKGSVPVINALVEAQGTPAAFDLRVARLEVAARDSGPFTVIQGTAAIRRDAREIHARLDLDLDQVAFADLPVLWPEGVGGRDSRRWVTENVTGGTAANAHVQLALRAPADLSDATVTSIAGGLDGHDLTVSWLSPIPPIEHGEGRLTFVSPDEIDIAVRGGQQGRLVLRGGSVRLTGIAGPDQFADLDIAVAGPLADAIVLLKNPRLNLFAHRSIAVPVASGELTAEVALPHLPLRDQVSMDDIQVHAAGKLSDAHVADVIAGKDLDHGELQWKAGNDGMQLSGNALLAGIPAQLSAAMDFRDGPPGQVLQKIDVSGTAQARQLAGLGLDLTDLMDGPAALQATLQKRRSGSGDVAVHADLAGAELHLARLNWSKPAGRPATVDAHLLLDHDQLTEIDRLRLAGPGLDVQGQMQFVNGDPASLRLQRLRLAPGTDAHGEVRWPVRPGAPWIVTMAGASIDASAELSHAGKRPAKPARPGPPWSLDAAFDRVLVGHGQSLTAVRLRAESDGVVTRQAQASGRTAPNAPFALTITPAPGGRRLSGSAADAGGLLRALDVLPDVEGGRMTLSGRYDDARSTHPLSGSAEITDFRVRGATALGKLLQAMTLYGLVDVLRGPGLQFSNMVAPFTLADDVLEIGDARAYSSSLGMTAKGRIDLAANVCAVQGTIVPAYFFNSLLGDIPLVGKLFSPERGGGVFAATYSVTGDCDDPAVLVNPLAALTPGFLRGLFAIFQGTPGTGAPAAGAPAGQR